MSPAMANDTTITIVGNLTEDPTLKFTPSGAAVVNFTIASTPRTFDRTKNEFVDGDALFLRCSLWRDAAEHVAESLTKGMRVIAQGRLKQRSYEKDGQKRTVVELDVEEIGVSLKYATAKVTKATGNGGRGNAGAPAGQRQSGGQATRSSAGGARQEDPWATGSAGAGGWGGSPADQEPPF